MEGKVDMTGVDTVAPIAAEVESSPSGIYWIPLPHSNAEGWKIIRAIFPLCQPLLCSIGAGIDPQKPIEFVTIPGPVFVTFDWMGEEICYWMTKLIAESYEGMEHAPWWTPKASLEAARCAPYHRGSVKFFKEKALWTDEQEKIDNSYIKLQGLLKRTFEAAKGEAAQKGIKDKEFPGFWLKKRAEALKETRP
jgi:hypothetical protein